MPFNGSGTFVRLYSWANDALAGIKIRADRMDNETNGIATGLSNCVTKDGQTTVTANLPMASFKHTGVGAATGRTDYAQAAQLVEGVINWKVAGGTGDALTAAYTIPTTTLVDGQLFYIRASAANTITAPTFAPDGLTARTITAQGGGTIAVGSIQNLVEMILRYNLANTRYEWVNYSAGNVVGQSSSVDSEIALFSGTGGKTIKRASGTGFVKVVSGVIQTPSAAAVTDLVSAATSGGVVIEASNGTDSMAFGVGNTANSTAYGNISMNTTGKIVNMANPTSAQDAATKAYVDANGGTLVQRKYAEIGTVVSCSTIPADNSIPQISEGTEVLSVSITPASITNRLRITFSTFGDVSSGSGPHTVAVFKDSTANALCAKGFARGDASVMNGVTLTYEFVPATTSAVTISARAGSNSGTLNINGNSAGTAFYGGVGFSTLVVEELRA